MNFVKEVQDDLKKVGYVAGEYLAAQVALLMAQQGGMVRTMLLDGPPGAGKTFLAQSVAAILNAAFVYIPAHPGSTPEDFLYDINIVQILRGVAGDKTAVQSAADVVEFGFLPTVFTMSQNGLVVALVDELDKSSPKVDSLFLSALQTGEVMVKGIGPVKANLDNIIIFFTKNGERMVSEPLMRRCRRVFMAFPEEDLELQILMGNTQKAQIDKPLQLPTSVEADPREGLLKLLVVAANKLREQELMIKPPCTSELSLAAADALLLKHWGVANSVTSQVVLRWLAAYQEDYVLASKVLNDKEEFERLLAMANGR